MEKHYYSKDYFELSISALKFTGVFVLCLIFTSSIAAALRINENITANDININNINTKLTMDSQKRISTGSEVYNSGESISGLYTNRTIHVGQSPREIVVSPDGKEVYVLTTTQIFIIDIKSDTVIETVPLRRCSVFLAYSLDGKKLYVANFDDDTVSVNDIATEATIATINSLNRPSGVALSPDGKKLYVANFGDGTVSVINTTTDNVTATFNVRPRITGIKVSPDGKKLYVVNYSSETVNILDIIDTTTNNVTATVNLGENLDKVAVSSDGKKIYALNKESNTISIINNMNPLRDVADESSKLNLIQKMELEEISALPQINADRDKVLKALQ